MTPIPKLPSTLFCALCGHKVNHCIPADDSRMRAVCPACGHVHYENPKMVVGTLTTYEDQVLLCKRAIEPATGKWTLPAGFMECGESLAHGAWRETFEEACAQPRLIEPVYHIVDIPHIGQTHLFFRAQLDSPEFGAGDETLEARLFSPEDIPWDDLVFRSAHSVLRTWLADRATGHFPTRHVMLENVSS